MTVPTGSNSTNPISKDHQLPRKIGRKSLAICITLSITALAVLVVSVTLVLRDRIPTVMSLETPLSNEDYLMASRLALDALEEYWLPEKEFFASPIRDNSLTNALYLQAVAILSEHELSTKKQRRRARSLVERLIDAPILSAEGGPSLDMEQAGGSHMSSAAPYCTAIAYAWKYSGKLGLDAATRERIPGVINQIVSWLEPQLDKTQGGANQLSLRWIQEVGYALHVVSEDEIRGIELMHRGLEAFLQHYSAAKDGFYRPWLNPDWTWIYNATNPQQSSPGASEYRSVLYRAE